MERKPQKPFARALFLLGILLGIVIGVMVSKRLFEPVKEHTQSRNPVLAEPKKPKSSFRKKLNTKKAIPSSFQDSMLLMMDTLDSDLEYLDSLIALEQDSAFDYYSWEDTIDVDNTEIVYEGEYGDFELAKDELVAVKFIVPSGNKSDFSCDTYDELDSLLMDYNKPHSDEKMRVEFWKSPLNYKGYILTRSKLAVFGIYEFNEVRLEYLEDGKIKLSYRDEFYILRCTDKFIPFR